MPNLQRERLGKVPHQIFTALLLVSGVRHKIRVRHANIQAPVRNCGFALTPQTHAIDLEFGTSLLTPALLFARSEMALSSEQSGGPLLPAATSRASLGSLATRTITPLIMALQNVRARVAATSPVSPELPPGCRAVVGSQIPAQAKMCPLL